MSHRIQIVVPDHVHQALVAAAAARETRPSTLAAAIVIESADFAPAAFRTKRSERVELRPEGDAFRTKRENDHQPEDQPEAFRAKRAEPEPADDAAPEPAAWLQRDRGPEWRDVMWAAVRELYTSYPELKTMLRKGWEDDRFARDGVFALAVWRQQIDEHAENDPRLELQWLSALQDYARNYEHHNRGRPSRQAAEPERPGGW